MKWHGDKEPLEAEARRKDVRLRELERKLEEIRRAAQPMIGFLLSMEDIFHDEPDDFALSRWPQGKLTIGDYRRLAKAVQP